MSKTQQQWNLWEALDGAVKVLSGARAELGHIREKYGERQRATGNPFYGLGEEATEIEDLVKSTLTRLQSRFPHVRPTDIEIILTDGGLKMNIKRGGLEEKYDGKEKRKY